MQTNTAAFVGRTLLALLGFNAIFSVQIFAQTRPVPLPPSVEKRPVSKTDHSGLPPVPQFRDVAAAVGLTATHISSSDKHYILDSMSGGIGLFDCDADGKLDLVMANGSTVERYNKGGDPLVTLYHQEPDGTFRDITKEAGLSRLGWGMGVAVADYDNDGKTKRSANGGSLRRQQLSFTERFATALWIRCRFAHRYGRNSLASWEAGGTSRRKRGCHLHP